MVQRYHKKGGNAPGLLVNGTDQIRVRIDGAGISMDRLEDGKMEVGGGPLGVGVQAGSSHGSQRLAGGDPIPHTDKNSVQMGIIIVATLAGVKNPDVVTPPDRASRLPI